MRRIVTTRAVRIAERLRRAWVEMDYAQRRMFELRTGVASLPATRRRRDVSSVEDLEALYALKARDPDVGAG